VVNIKEDLEFSVNIPDFLKKIKLEWIFLVIFAVFLLVFISVYEGGVVKHDSPYQLIAGDMFTFTAFSEVAKDTNQYSFLPPYMANGITDAANLFSPIPGIIVAQLALFSGAETYDTVLHLNIFFLILMILGSYLALRYINKEIAILGIVLGLLAWKWPLSYIINWGAQLSVVNFFFIIAGLLSFLFLKERFMFIVFGIINAASFIAHGREFQTFNVAVVLFFIAYWAANKFDFKKLDWPWIKNYLLSVVVTIVLLFRYIPILREFGKYGQTTAARGTLLQYCSLSPDSYHYVSFAHLGIFKWLIFIGIIFAIYLLIKKFNEKPYLGFIIIYSLTFIISSYFCIYGNKTTQIRHFFPIFLIPLLGIGVYFLIVLLKKQLKNKILLASVIIAVALLFVAAVSHQPRPVSEYPVSNPLTWEGIKWIEENTDEDARVVVLYGDNFYQETLFYLLKRPFYNVLSDKYIDTIRGGTIPPEYNMTFSILGHHWTRKSLFELEITSYSGPNRENQKEFVGSLCDFEYVFSNKVSRNEVLSTYTQTLLNLLLQEGNFIVVFENDLMVVLENQDVGGECFNERRITG